MDVTFSAGPWTKDDGTEKNLTFEFTHGNTPGAKFDANGEKVTITLDSSKNYSAAEIKALLANVDNTAMTGASDAEKAAVAEVVKNTVVTGKGTIGVAGGNGFGANTAGGPVKMNGKPMQLQIGDTSQKYDQLSVKVGDLDTKGLGIDDLDISTPEGASAAIDKIKAAINTVSSTRGDLGAIQNRLEHTQNNLSVMTENIQDAESTIRDTDVAEEMMAYTKNNILIQSAQAMLAQANQVPQGVLQLMQ